MTDLIEIGYIKKTHGYNGEIKAKIHADILFKPETINAIFVEYKGEQIPHFISTFNLTSEVEALIHFEEFESKESAQLYRGSKLFLKNDEVEIVADENSANQYIGYMIKDTIHGEIGEVEDVYEFPHQDLLAVNYKSKEVLIPFQEDLISELQEAQKTIIFNLPEGFLEI